MKERILVLLSAMMFFGGSDVFAVLQMYAQHSGRDDGTTSVICCPILQLSFFSLLFLMTTKTYTFQLPWDPRISLTHAIFAQPAWQVCPPPWRDRRGQGTGVISEPPIPCPPGPASAQGGHQAQEGLPAPFLGHVDRSRGGMRAGSRVGIPAICLTFCLTMFS